MRAEIERLVARIAPGDGAERNDLDRALEWLRSGAGLCRTASPASPDPHLVAYFAVVDREQILLGDHLKSGLWLPSGGHVEPGEHPRETVIREAREELSLRADFLFDAPVFLTMRRTVGAAPHTDVSLWYALRGDRTRPVLFDPSEYRAVGWFAFADLPTERSLPEIARFAAKLTRMREAA